jgi:hypothetical protein
MRKFFMVAFILAAMLVFATSGFALEKRLAYSSTDRPDDWESAGSQTCLLVYWNGCVGWTWVWSGWGAQEQFGVVFDVCNTAATNSLISTEVFVWSASPPGYGFTGTVDVHAVDVNNCPTGAALASMAFLPGPATSWVTHNWNVVVPDKFSVTHTTGNAAFANPGEFTSDFDAQGPTGPNACGLCYPSNRTPHSYYYGPNGAFCPSPLVLSSGASVCNSEWRWEALMHCSISVEEASWGSIKNLYR